MYLNAAVIWLSPSDSSSTSSGVRSSTVPRSGWRVSLIGWRRTMGMPGVRIA